MKKIAITAAVLLSVCLLRADTVHILDNAAMPEGDLKIFYSEKYFEYAAIYDGFLFPSSTEWQERPQMVRGIIYNAGVRAGFGGGFGAALLMTYIAQKSGDGDRNDLQCAYLAGEKNFPGMVHLRAGIKIPAVWGAMDEGFINRGGYYGIFASANTGSEIADFLWDFSIGAETGFVQSAPQSLFADASAGYRVFRDEGHAVEFMLNAEYASDSSEGSRAYLVPEARIRFSGGFNFNLGVELLFYADDALLNRYDKILYRAGVSYTVLSASGGEVTEKDAVKDGATWKEQQIDPEMVPESWLKEDQKK